MKGELSSSIVRISGDKHKDFGTGFVIHRDAAAAYVMTCAHVIETPLRKGEQIKVGRCPADVIEMGEADGLDLAVLRVQGLAGAPPLRIRDQGEPGRSFTVLGFRSFERHFLLGQVSGKLGHKVFLESSAEQGPERIEAWTLRVEGDDTLLRGYSGSPVVDEATQDVLGIVSYRQGEGHKGVAISVKAIPTVWPSGPRDVLGGATGKEINPLEIVAELERLLGLTRDAIIVSVKRYDLLRLELPAPAAERLVSLYEENILRIPPLEIQHIEVIREASPIANKSEGPQPTSTKDPHTFRVSLSGPVTQGTNNRLSLMVENTSSQNYRRVTLQLSVADSAILLRPTLWRFPLAADSSKAMAVSLGADQPGTYYLQVRVNSIPAPADGFLRTTLPLIVQPSPSKSQIEIEFA
jgi:hypothetical protein